jgi:Fanconi-associated nuclease 1
MTPPRLSSAKKRAYVAYNYRRTPNIWSSREDLIAFEEAIKLEADLDALLDGNGIPPTKAKVDGKYSTPRKSSSPVKRSRMQTPSMTPKLEDEHHDSGENDGIVHDVIKLLTPRQLAAQAALNLVGGVLEQWRQLVKLKSEEAPRQGGLALFEAGE